MRSTPAVLIVLVLAACGPREEEQATPPASVPSAEPAAPAARTIADFAGTWENVVTLEGTAEPVPSTLSGSAAGDDWTLKLADRSDIPLRVSMSGDSLVTESAEYESVLRPGVMVTVRTAGVLEGDLLVGNMVANYRTPAGVETVRGTTRATRVN